MLVLFLLGCPRDRLRCHSFWLSYWACCLGTLLRLSWLVEARVWLWRWTHKGGVLERVNSLLRRRHHSIMVIPQLLMHWLLGLPHSHLVTRWHTILRRSRNFVRWVILLNNIILKTFRVLIHHHTSEFLLIWNWNWRHIHWIWVKCKLATHRHLRHESFLIMWPTLSW